MKITEFKQKNNEQKNKNKVPCVKAFKEFHRAHMHIPILIDTLAYTHTHTPIETSSTKTGMIHKHVGIHYRSRDHVFLWTD